MLKNFKLLIRLSLMIIIWYYYIVLMIAVEIA